MSFLTSILSNIDPSAAVAVAKATPPTNGSNLTHRPASQQAASSAQPVKRKAEAQPERAQTKVPRKDSIPPLIKTTNGGTRPPAAPNVGGAKPTTPTSTIPYRGTAGGVLSKPVNSAVKKPTAPPLTVTAPTKPATPTAKPSTATTPTSGKAPAQPKLGSYAAMLAKAREAAEKKVIAPPVKHEPTKVLSRKERLALAAESKTTSKGRATGSNGNVRAANGKLVEAGKDKRKPVDVGYQGTARPKKPVEIGYKGTARPSSSTTLGKATGAKSAAAGARAKADRGKYGGYASWSDEELDEEEDYASDASSDMEGGLWDVEEEEKRALEAAKKEDALALAEENELKRQKEERKRKLMAMNKAAAAKKKY